MLAGAGYAASMAAATGRSVALALGLVAGGVVAAVALGLAFKAATGSEGFTFYHHQLVVLAATAGLLTLLRRPPLPYLDLIGLTLGLVQAFGRLGCLMAGCCHGRPAGWGLRYGEDHAAIGFRPSLVGVPLFPIQAVESLGLFALVGGGTAALLAGSAAGTAFTSYLVAYGTLRFALELARGDDARPYRLGLSEAQWTALACLAAVAAGEAAGLLPLARWHAAAAALAAAAAAGIALARRLRGADGLLAPRHVGEVADLLDGGARAAPAPGRSPLFVPPLAPPPIALGRTSLGIRISASARPGDGAHYALSRAGAALPAAAARRLARLILRLRHPRAPEPAGGRKPWRLPPPGGTAAGPPARPPCISPFARGARMSRRKSRSPLGRAAGSAGAARSGVRPTAPPIHPMLQLQQAAGNRATEQLIRSGLDEPAAGETAAPAADTAPAAAVPAAADTAPAAAAPQAAAAGLIVDDEAADAGPGQMRKGEFLDALEARVCASAQTALAGTGRTTDGCPWIEHWFEHYRGQSAAHVERALRRYAPEAAGVAAAAGYIPIVVQRVQASVEVWARTGEVTGVPEDVPMPGAGILGIFGGMFGGVRRLFGGGAPAPGGEPAAPEGAATAAVRRMARPADGGRAAGGGGPRPAAVERQLGPGAALDGGLQSRMESAFGQSLSHVRVHADRTAAGLSDQLAAKAFAVGPHIAFGAGEFQPGTPLGDGLIAHELAHVVQQEGAAAAPPQGEADHRALEADADHAAAGAVLSLWGRGRGGLGRLAAGTRRAAGGGLRLQRCASGQKQVASPKAAAAGGPRFADLPDVDAAKWRQGVEQAEKLEGDAKAQALGALLQQELGKAATVHVATQTHTDQVHPDDYQEYPAINLDLGLKEKKKWNSSVLVGENPGFTFTSKGKTYVVLGPGAIDKNVPGKSRMYADHESFHATDTGPAGKAARKAELEVDREIRKETDADKLAELRQEKKSLADDTELRIWTETFVAYFDPLRTDRSAVRWTQLAVYDRTAHDSARSASLERLVAYHDDPPVAKERKAEVRKKLRMWLYKELQNDPTTKLYQQLAARIKLGEPPEP